MVRINEKQLISLKCLKKKRHSQPRRKDRKEKQKKLINHRSSRTKDTEEKKARRTYRKKLWPQIYTDKKQVKELQN